MDLKTEDVFLEPQRIGQRLCELRTIREWHVDTMRRSLRRHGQLTPVTVARLESGYEMVDGFKRLRAALEVPGMERLRCRVRAENPRAAKIAMFCLNQHSSGLNDLETALILQSLHRAERMTQAQIAEALGRHKTWVCRRLQLVERLSPRAQEDIRVGLVSPTAARDLVKLPRGNQGKLLDAVLDQRLSTRQITKVVKGYEKAKTRAEREAILSNPRGALEAKRGPEETLNEKLTSQGRQALKKVLLLERVGIAVAAYLEMAYPEASADRALLRPYLARMTRALKLLMERFREPI